MVDVPAAEEMLSMSVQYGTRSRGRGTVSWPGSFCIVQCTISLPAPAIIRGMRDTTAAQCIRCGPARTVRIRDNKKTSIYIQGSGSAHKSIISPSACFLMYFFREHGYLMHFFLGSGIVSDFMATQPHDPAACGRVNRLPAAG